MWGEPRVAAECTCTEREFGRCSRPTVRPGRNVHDERDHGDGSSTRPRGRRPADERLADRDPRSRRAVLVAADRTMNPCPLDGTDQLARHVLAACIEPDGPVDADGDQARVIDDARHPAFLPGGERRHGRGTRPPGRLCDGRDAAGARAPLSRDRRPGVPGGVSMSVPPPPNGVRGKDSCARPRRSACAHEGRAVLCSLCEAEPYHSPHTAQVADGAPPPSSRPQTRPQMCAAWGEIRVGIAGKVAEIAVTPTVSDGYAKARRPSDYDPMERTPQQASGMSGRSLFDDK